MIYIRVDKKKIGIPTSPYELTVKQVKLLDYFLQHVNENKELEDEQLYIELVKGFTGYKCNSVESALVIYNALYNLLAEITLLNFNLLSIDLLDYKIPRAKIISGVMCVGYNLPARSHLEATSVVLQAAQKKPSLIGLLPAIYSGKSIDEMLDRYNEGGENYGIGIYYYFIHNQVWDSILYTYPELRDGDGEKIHHDSANALAYELARESGQSLEYLYKLPVYEFFDLLAYYRKLNKKISRMYEKYR